ANSPCHGAALGGSRGVKTGTSITPRDTVVTRTSFCGIAIILRGLGPFFFALRRGRADGYHSTQDPLDQTALLLGGRRCAGPDRSHAGQPRRDRPPDLGVVAQGSARTPGAG